MKKKKTRKKAKRVAASSPDRNEQAWPEIKSALPKALPGIPGLADILHGGFPRDRVTLVAGGSGTGKTLFSMQFINNGAVELGEAGVFVSFEEKKPDLERNFKSLGWDLKTLEKKGLLRLVEIDLDQGAIIEAGDFDFSGITTRIQRSIEEIGARRIVLDTVDQLFTAFSDQRAVRTAIRQLFRWLQGTGCTSIVTGESQDGSLTRAGLEQFVSDCVLSLELETERDAALRRLQIRKYRGSTHGSDKYPFVILKDGVEVFPTSTFGTPQSASHGRISTGIDRLDAMLGGGLFETSTVLISGSAGTGKTIIAAHIAEASCRARKKVLFFSFEESSDQICRNLHSLGLDLRKWMENGKLIFNSRRPTRYSLDSYYPDLRRQIDRHKPALIIFDPMSAFWTIASYTDIHILALRLADLCKSRGITLVMNVLMRGLESPEETEMGLSSLSDTWLLLRNHETDFERVKLIHVLKSRGTSHSNQLHEFTVTQGGISIENVYVGPDGVVAGSARMFKEAQDKAETQARRKLIERKKRELERKRRLMAARLDEIRVDFEAEQQDILLEIMKTEEEDSLLEAARNQTKKLRHNE